MIPARSYVACLLTACVLIMSSANAISEESADNLLAQIKARSEKTKQFRDLLNDPDQATRLAALDVMLKSDDLAMRELAFGIGFSSADDAMRAVCLKNKFSYLNTLSIKLTATDKATEGEKKTLEKWGSSYPLTIKKYELNTGALVLSGQSSSSQGQVNGIGIEFTDAACNGRLVLGDGTVLTGEVSCTGTYSGVYPATLRLQ